MSKLDKGQGETHSCEACDAIARTGEPIAYYKHTCRESQGMILGLNPISELYQAIIEKQEELIDVLGGNRWTLNQQKEELFSQLRADIEELKKKLK